MDILRNYHFAGVNYQIVLPEDRAYTEEKYLAPFRTQSVTNPHIFRFSFVEELDPPLGDYITTQPGFCVFTDGGVSVRYIGSVQKSWEQAYMRVFHQGRQHDVQVLSKSVKGRIGTHTVLTALALEHLVVTQYGFVFHSAFIERNGKGILFTAPSGTGKSTQADLWNRLRDAQIINGDRSVIRVRNENVTVHGIPFAGSSSYCLNKTLPLTAIVYLEQAPESSIRKVRGYEAFRRIWEGVSVNTWDKQDMEQITETVTKVLQKVPVFHLACTPDESAVIALERALSEIGV